MRGTYLSSENRIYHLMFIKQSTNKLLRLLYDDGLQDQDQVMHLRQLLP